MSKIFNEVVMADPNAVEVVPTIENVDFYRIYVYKNTIPTFGMFDEEKYKFDKNNVNRLYKEMVGNNWEGDVEIEVDINTLNIAKHNHTYAAYAKAKVDGFNKPLLVRYVNIENKDNTILKGLLKDEWTKKFRPNAILLALMSKEGEEDNTAKKVYDYCMGHQYLKGSDKSFKLGMGFICLFGESKPYMKELKRGHLNQRNTKVDYTSYDLLDKALAIRDAAGMDNVAGMESFLRMWYKFYNVGQNKSYFKVGGWDKYIASVPKVVNAMGGIETKQGDEYYRDFFDIVLEYTKGRKTLKDISKHYNVNTEETEKTEKTEEAA